MMRIIKFNFSRDIQAVLTVEKNAFGEKSFPIFEFAYLFNKGGDTFFVAYVGKQLVGYISAYIDDEIGYIASIAVDSQFRRQGIARQLIQKVISTIKDQSNALELHVRQSNQSAIALYKSMGFIVKASEADYYEDEDAYRMSLTLTKSET